MDGGLKLTLFASSEPLYDNIHWIEWVAFGSTLIFALITIILILCITFSKKQKFISGPFYLRKATPILKWIAVTSPLIITLGSLIEFYNSLFLAGIRDDTGIEYWIGPFANVIIMMVIGLGVSLLCLVGMTIHFFKTLEPAEPRDNE